MSETEADPNRPSEPNRSSLVVCSTLVLLPPLKGLSFPAFLVDGSVKMRGRGVASATEETEAAGKSVEAAWLDVSAEGKTKPDGPELDSTACSSAADVFAACCLAALDCGLRCAAILARVCKTDDLHQKSKLRNRKAQRQRHMGLTLCALGSVVTWTGVSKLTPCSGPAWAPVAVESGLELNTLAEDLGAAPGKTPTAPGRVGVAPGSKATGLISRLA